MPIVVVNESAQEHRHLDATFRERQPECFVLPELAIQYSVVAHEKGLAARDEAFAPVYHIVAIIGDRKIVEELAGEVIVCPPRHIAAMQADAKPQRIA